LSGRKGTYWLAEKRYVLTGRKRHVLVGRKRYVRKQWQRLTKTDQVLPRVEMAARRPKRIDLKLSILSGTISMVIIFSRQLIL
jgi:hypothetical protein